MLQFFAILLLKLSFSKVYEIFHRDHFHDLLQDLPVGGRYVSVIAFYNNTAECNSQFNSLDFNQNNLPGPMNLLLGKYEMSTEYNRVWYEYEEHLDLPTYIGLRDYINNNNNCNCPILVYFPITYANSLGNLYLNNPILDGIKIWNSNEYNSWKDWLYNNLFVKFKILQKYPYNFEVTVIPNQLNGRSNAKSFTINAMESHTIIEGYIGDSFYVSNNPRSVNYRDPKPTDVTNPSYIIYPDINELILEEDNNGRFGFNIGVRRFIESDRFVKKRHSTTMMTHTRNLIIPKVLPNHDKLGFKKIKMPNGLHERLTKYYRHHYPRRAVESWDDVGTQLNFFKVKSYMISLDHDWRERDNIANKVIKPILLEWSNETSLELTAFYGIREYERDAVLRNHVDRIDTHVYSAILQIGQTGINSPWPLEVIGFDGKRYLITLKPGEMILYEGAKLIHGRPHPFNGTLFSNAFVHFKPTRNDWPWNTGKIWRTEIAQQTLNNMHISLQDIYR